MVNIFQELDMRDVREIEQAARRVSFPAGKILYSPNEAGAWIFILKKGSVQLYRMSAEGRKFLIHNLREGAVFGETALLGPGVYDTFAETEEDCLVYIIDRPTLERLIRSQPQLAIRLLNSVCWRLREVEERLEETTFHGLPNRLALLLLRLRSDCGSDFLSVTHEELAEHLGTYRETVTATLGCFKRKGLISIKRRQIEVKDMARLQSWVM